MWPFFLQIVSQADPYLLCCHVLSVLHCRGLHALQCVSMLPSFHGWLNFSNGWCFCIADNGHDPESGV